MSDVAHAQATRCDRLVDLPQEEQARVVELRSPGWVCWYGRATGEFWAAPEASSRWWGLVSGETPETLSALIGEVDAFYGRRA